MTIDLAESMTEILTRPGPATCGIGALVSPGDPA
jgi:hypothetical protein